jgi:hypothetical protein
MNTGAAPPTTGQTPSDSVDTIHRAWRKNRDAAVAEFFAGFKDTPDWSSLALRPAPGGGSGDNRLWVSFVTIAAVSVEAHEPAADGYYSLANMTEAGPEAAPESRLWYARSLDHAQLAGNDFAIARAAYCLGCIDASRGLTEDARNHFLTSRDHADKAGNPGGKAASLYRLALLAMDASEFKAASDYAFDSYLISRKAGQLEPAAETLIRLFAFWHTWSFDELAVKPAIDLMSAAVQAIVSAGGGEGDIDSARRVAALTLRAIAPLRPEVRDDILRSFNEMFGDQVGDHLRYELDTIIADTEQQK